MHVRCDDRGDNVGRARVAMAMEGFGLRLKLNKFRGKFGGGSADDHAKKEYIKRSAGLHLFEL